MEKLFEYCQTVAANAKQASRQMSLVSGTQKNHWLRTAAKMLVDQTETLLAANKIDLEAAPGFGLKDSEIDRLLLNPKRIGEIAVALEEIAMFPDPIGQVIESTVRPNGIDVQKVRVPLGVVFFIYESRPNVTPDAAAICVKSSNAVILRGGKEAFHSNMAFGKILKEAALKTGLPEHIVQLVETTDRDAVGHFLKMSGKIDVAIPRGGESLIRRVSEEAKMPVMKHFAGNCHVYIDQYADPNLAEKILLNAKCQRTGVCNAAESLVIHQAVAETLLPRLAKALDAQGVELRCDEPSFALLSPVLPDVKQATDADFKAEYLALTISVKVAGSLDEAIEHINFYSDAHTETIITKDLNAAREFAARIDSSAVMINASTRFNDGGQFGLGAEIGISTDKFHARGPCGVNELTSYKYIVYGTGQIRE